MKLSMKDMFAGVDIALGGNVVLIGQRMPDGKIKVLETLWPKDADVAEAIAHAINFTADIAAERH